MTSAPNPVQSCEHRLRNRGGVDFHRGFTLIEVLVTLAIIGLLAGVIAPRVINYLPSSRTKSARLQIENLAAGLELYRLDVGEYPAEHEGLAVLVERPFDGPNWNGPYLKGRSAFVDPWGRPFVYRIPGEHGIFDLYSLGADGMEGGEDENKDVASWQ
jgi:general secretion pathway protein G